MKSNEEEVLELIKFALECNNDTLAIRHIEQYGFFKQGGYKQAESKQLNMHDVVGRSEQLKAVEELVDFARDVTNVCDLDRLEEILDRL